MNLFGQNLFMQKPITKEFVLHLSLCLIANNITYDEENLKPFKATNCTVVYYHFFVLRLNNQTSNNYIIPILDP